MLEDANVSKKRIRTLSESSRSDDSTSDNDNSDLSCNDSIGCNLSIRQVRSRKQNIRELREEFEDDPELYGIRRSSRSRREPLRFKPSRRDKINANFGHKRRCVSVSSSDSNQLSDSDEWSDRVLKNRTVRTRGNRVNYTSAFKDDNSSQSDENFLEDNLTTKYGNNRIAQSNSHSNQQACFQKPRGPLIRKPHTPVVVAVRTNKSKESNDYFDESKDASDQDVSDEDYTGKEAKDFVCGEDEEADVIEDVLMHAVRRKGATGNPTTMYNTRLEKDLNAGFDAKREEGELQFLIKWRNWSYMHSTWETESSLRNPERGSSVVGMQKFYKYETIIKEKKERLAYMEREDLEILAYEEEREEQILQDKMKVERIVAHSRDPDTNSFDYLIKWFRLDYRFCSWESGKVIRALYEQDIQLYETRCRGVKLPNPKCDALHCRPKFFPLSKQPDYLGNSDYRLRDYQLEGINWILRAWTKGNSVILADEMGLGKTIQTIGFLSCLFHEYDLYGPILIIVPLSTISSWQNELQTWAPDMNTIIYTGDHVSRQLIREHEWALSGFHNRRQQQQALKFNVCVTTYEILLKDKLCLGQVNWAFLGVDEAHRLKNDASQLYKALMQFQTNTRLLITGTPLQNTMKELWALLHFVMPDIFQNWTDFEEAYSVVSDDPVNRMNGESFHNLHKALRPFLLRRVKKDVESSLPEKIEQLLRVDMTKEQINIYRLILARNYDGLMKVTRGHKASFVNIVMELKKCCNHSHLIAPPTDNDQQFMSKEDRLRHFIVGSGKATLLDKLLLRLKSRGHRVLIFSQMVRMLDLIADYLALRGWGFQRLDGSIRGEVRKQALDHFNAEGSTDFCFLLSTRAGGLGINLATADTVIIFDSDWNPQNDLQAQARAHRIGQKKQVSVYRLVTRKSVEEKIIESATRKMVLDHLVIQRMDSSSGRGRRSDVAKGHLLTEILRYGAEGLFKQDDDSAELEVDIDDILNCAETRDTEATVESSSANALLSSFKVVNLDALEDELFDDGRNQNSTRLEKSWDEIIPNELRGKIKAEEASKTLVELELGPRRRKPVKAFQAGVDTNSSSDVDSLAEDADKSRVTQLSEKEIRALVRAIRHFARPLERIDAIAADAELPDYSEAELKEAIDAILKGCKMAMDLSNVQEETSKVGANMKGPVFQYGRVSVSVRPLLQSLEYLEILHQCLPSESRTARMSYVLPFVPKPVAWSCSWDASDDVRLLTGVYEHGYDNWETIKLDADLGLGTKLLPILQSERPQSNHLRSRVDYLLKMLSKTKNVHSIADSGAGKKKKRNDSDGAKNKGRLSIKKTNRKSTSKSASGCNLSATSKPKSVEFVETDDSSSDSNEFKDAKNSYSSKKMKKNDSKTKLKSDNNREDNDGIKQNDHSVDDCKTSFLFTEDDQNDFRHMRGPLFLKCKEKLLPIKKHLKQLESLEDMKEEDSKQLSKVMLRIGDHIHSEISELLGKHEKNMWKNYLWEFVHIFSKKSADDLRHIYRYAMKRRTKKEQLKDINSDYKQRHQSTISDNGNDKTASSNSPPRHEKYVHHKIRPSHQNNFSHRYSENVENHRQHDRHGGLFDQRKRTHGVTSSGERNENYDEHASSYKHGGSGFNSEWSSSSTKYKRENSDARFNNAFNRIPGHSDTAHSFSKSYNCNDRFNNSSKSQNYTNPGSYGKSDLSFSSPKFTDTYLNHATFHPSACDVPSRKSVQGLQMEPTGSSYSSSISRDPRLSSSRR